MKTMKSLLFLSILLACTALYAETAYGIESSIILDKKNHILIGPEASSYQWFYNGKQMMQTGKSIPVNAPGTYQVMITDAAGEQRTASITVGIDNDGEVYTIYIIGDSTASYWDPNAYYPLTGWGQVFPWFFDSNVVIKNEALSARSSKSFYDDHWEPIRDSLNPGDFVLIQFGINDSKSDDPNRYTDPFTTFQEYLTLFVTESQEKGAFPVLLTTVRRNAWNETDPPTLYPAYHDYPVATRELAGELEVPLIDIDQLAIPLLEGLGPDYTGPFLYWNLAPGEYPKYPDGKEDDVHFQEMGAIEMAKIVAEAIGSAEDDTVLNRLIPHLKPMYQVDISTNFPEGAIITQSAAYPEGINVTVKAIEEPGYDLLEWQDGDGVTLSTENLYQFTMGNDSLSLFALLDDDPEPDCAGVLNGAAFVDECGLCVDGTTEFLACTSEIEPGTYKLISHRSALCIEEGEDITHEECINDNSQLWEFIREGSEYKIKNVGSGKYLYCDTLVRNTKVTTGDEEMLWRLEKVGTDTFQIVPKENPELIMELMGTTVPGQYCRIYQRNGGIHQMFRFQESFPVGYNELQDVIKPWRMYPNPTSGEVTLEVDRNPGQPVNLEVYDLQGKMVFQEIKVSGIFKFGKELHQGIYFVKVSDDFQSETLKLVKN